MSTPRNSRPPLRGWRIPIGMAIIGVLVIASALTLGLASGSQVAQHGSGDASAAQNAMSSTHSLSRAQGHASYVSRSSSAAQHSFSGSSSSFFPGFGSASSSSNRLLADSTACGINGSGFEDDDGNLAVDDTLDGCMDWNGFAPVTWAGTAPYQTATKTTGLFSLLGVSDAITSPDTNYKGGSKQDTNCPDIVNTPTTNKDDLARIYIAGERINNHPYLFLGWVRAPQNTVNSDLHVAFEFNQSTTPCANSSLVPRTDGDLLIGYDFQSSGVTITVSVWDSSLNSGKGGWGPATDIIGVGVGSSPLPGVGGGGGPRRTSPPRATPRGPRTRLRASRTASSRRRA